MWLFGNLLFLVYLQSSNDQPTFSSISHDIPRIFINLNHIYFPKLSLSCSVLYILLCSHTFFVLVLLIITNVLLSYFKEIKIKVVNMKCL